MDFETSFGGGMHMNALELNNGEKWVLKSSTIELINSVSKRIDDFESKEITDYNDLGKEIFKDVKTIMTDDDYAGDLFEQIHNFFGGVEGHMHSLMAAESIVEATEELENLKVKFDEFDSYFE
jgi:hypothetical protein